MIGRLKALITGPAAEAAAEKFDERTIAAAALLVEVAMVDNDFSDAERGRILTLIRERLVDDPALSEELVVRAEAEIAGTVQLFAFTSVVTDGFSYDERVDLMRSLWEVVLADGEVDPFEDQLMRRLGGLIHVSDRDRAATRKQAQEALAGRGTGR